MLRKIIIIGFLIGAILSGLLSSAIFAIIPNLSLLNSPPSDPLDEGLPSLEILVTTLVNTLFLFPSIIVWVIGIFHTIRINNPIEGSQQFTGNIPL
jgi:hypothetical protein